MGFKEWIQEKKEKKATEDEWKAEVKAEAIKEAREEAKGELKKKYMEEEKARLVSGKSKFLSTLEKEFGRVGEKMKNTETGGGEKNVVGGIDFKSKLEQEFGGKGKSKDPTLKNGDEISALMGVKKSDDIMTKDKVDKMLGKSIDTSNPHHKIGEINFGAGVDRAMPKFKKKKNDD